VRYRQLGTHGPLVSELGFGASPLGGIYGGFAEKAGIDAVHAALDAGITFFDVAPYYGHTAAETVLGKALRGIERERYVLATKVGRYGDQVFDFSAGAVTRSVRDSLARLGVDYVDLIQCHDVEFGALHQVASETIPALRALQDAGLVRGVGITGYPLPALARIAARTPVDTVMSYCQYTLQDRRLAACVKEFAAVGAATINASPLAMGALTGRGAPPWHPASAEVLARCARAAAACQVHGADLAKLALQFSVTTSPCVSTVIGSASPANVRRNITWIEEPLDQEMLASIEAILAPVRDQGWSADEPGTRIPASTDMAAQVLDSVLAGMRASKTERDQVLARTAQLTNRLPGPAAR
jgi:L-galactose dehydrogenase